MASIQVIRNVVGLDKEHVAAGYGNTPWPMAITFLDHVADEYAKQQRLTVRKANREVDGKDHQERILSDHTGADVVRFFLRVKQK